MADTKISALTAATDLVSADIAGQQGGTTKRFTTAIFDARYQSINSNLTSWASVTRASGYDTFATTPSSANLKALLTDEVGTGAAYFIGGALGTPSSVTLTNGTGLPISGLTASTSTSIGVGSIELGHASDTTLARVSSGDFSVEGNIVYRAGGTDIPVTDGGTGVSSTTAYGILCGGTTSTGAFQSVSSLGTAGQVLTSNGAGTLPTFQSIGSTTKLNAYTSSTTWNKPAGLVGIVLRVRGASGGGGGANRSSTNAQGGWGGGAPIAEKYILAASLGSSETVTIGAKGTGGAAGANNGTAGGTTSFGSHISISGGGAGLGGNNAAGSNGSPGAVTGTVSSLYDAGGASLIGTGPTGGSQSYNSGVVSGFVQGNGTAAPTGTGNGGGGGFRNANGTASGGDGDVGYIEVTEYYA